MEPSGGADPFILVLAGPNGAGKTTASPHVLRDFAGVEDFVNADEIARGLSAFNPEAVAMAAGRVMLERLGQLADRRASFAFETTLPGRGYRSWLEKRVTQGYRVALVFLWLPSPEVAVTRVSNRVAHGGHSIPPEVIARRYAAGLRNFFGLYREIAATWQVATASFQALRQSRLAAG